MQTRIARNHVQSAIHNGRYLLLFLALCLTGLTTNETARGDLIEISFGSFEYAIETDKSIYSLGETVYATHTISNPHAEPLTIWGMESPGFDLWVMKDGAKLWWYHRAFPQVVMDYTLDSGESEVFQYTWDMTDYDDNMIAPGEYEIVGVTHGGMNVSTQITIVPEPATITLLALAVGIGLSRRRK